MGEIQQRKVDSIQHHQSRKGISKEGQQKKTKKTEMMID